MADVEPIIGPEMQTEPAPMYTPEPQVLSETAPEYAPAPAEAPKTSFKKPLILVASAVMLVAAFVLFFVFALPAIRYSSGIKAFDNGDYAKSVKLFSKLDDYKHSDEYLAQSEQGVHYNNACALVEEGNYAEAIEEYKLAQDFLDSRKLLNETYILYGDELVTQGKYDEAIAEYNKANASDKVADAYNLKGEDLFQQKRYADAAEAFGSAGNEDRQVACAIRLIEDNKDYATAHTILKNCYSSTAVAYNYYTSGMLSLESGDYPTAINYFGACTGLLDADSRKVESIFLLAEQKLHEGYLNKAKSLYNTLPSDYSHNGIAVSDRIKLLNDNKQFVDLVGIWHATYNFYKVESNSYNYYWYQDTAKTGTVTVVCPYNDDGTFTIKGTAAYPVFTNWSTKATDLKTSVYSYSFETTGKTVPYQIGSSTSVNLTFNGNQFSLYYSYVNASSANVTYTFTSNAHYGRRVMMADDQ